MGKQAMRGLFSSCGEGIVVGGWSKGWGEGVGLLDISGLLLLKVIWVSSCSTLYGCLVGWKDWLVGTVRVV